MSCGKFYFCFNIASAGLHGRIIHQGSISVQKGADQNFQIKPDTGYAIDQVLIDNVPIQQIIPEYTFYNISENHRIEVTFQYTGSLPPENVTVIPDAVSWDFSENRVKPLASLALKVKFGHNAIQGTYDIDVNANANANGGGRSDKVSLRFSIVYEDEKNDFISAQLHPIFSGIHLK
ncbi:hypothetical protein MHK_004406 [Candidatus Magnetomorum sp. HK-1]|nr:hypothetical protein MHK_004406 [Candidatus Magnetomorum sp. HK-1]